jgi:hypothetical protein
MGKTVCKEKKILKKQDGKKRFECKKCEARVVKEKHVCKPRKL